MKNFLLQKASPIIYVQKQRLPFFAGLALLIMYSMLFISVAEPEPELVEPKLFCGAGAGTGAVISNFGSGSAVPELKLYF